MHNSNFFPVTVDVLNVTLTNYAGMEVGVGTVPVFDIDSRSYKNVSVTLLMLNMSLLVWCDLWLWFVGDSAAECYICSQASTESSVSGCFCNEVWFPEHSCYLVLLGKVRNWNIYSIYSIFQEVEYILYISL